MKCGKGVWVRLAGALLGGVFFSVVYALANHGFESLSLTQRMLPRVFGVVVGLLLADAWYRRKKPATTAESACSVDDSEPES